MSQTDRPFGWELDPELVYNTHGELQVLPDGAMIRSLPPDIFAGLTEQELDRLNVPCSFHREEEEEARRQCDGDQSARPQQFPVDSARFLLSTAGQEGKRKRPTSVPFLHLHRAQIREQASAGDHVRRIEYARGGERTRARSLSAKQMQTDRLWSANVRGKHDVAPASAPLPRPPLIKSIPSPRLYFPTPPRMTPPPLYDTSSTFALRSGLGAFPFRRQAR